MGQVGKRISVDMLWWLKDVFYRRLKNEGKNKPEKAKPMHDRTYVPNQFEYAIGIPKPAYELPSALPIELPIELPTELLMRYQNTHKKAGIPIHFTFFKDGYISLNSCGLPLKHKIAMDIHSGS